MSPKDENKDKTAPEVDVEVASRVRISEDGRAELHKRLDEVIDATNTDPNRVTGIRGGHYQTITKDAEGEAHIHDLYKLEFIQRFSDAQTAPAWELVQPATPAIIQAFSAPKQPLYNPRSGQKSLVAVIIPDPQIGYWLLQEGNKKAKLMPFHDENAMSISIQVIADINPDLVVCLGDFLDFPAYSRYEQLKEFAETTQVSIERGHSYLAQIRANAPNAKIVVLEGNHDRRLQNMLNTNAQRAWGLKRATDLSGWPVMTVPYLCAFDSLEVEYLEGYGAAAYWINERLKCIHGVLVRGSGGGATARAVVNDETVSTIFGHIHRHEHSGRTANKYKGAVIAEAYSPGCICRIDGAVPSVRGSTVFNGKPVERYENWQQGLGVVHYSPGDRPFHIEHITINTHDGYQTFYGGKYYYPNKSTMPRANGRMLMAVS